MFSILLDGKYSFQKKSNNEYSSCCPKNGNGDDRFILFTDNGKERWICRGGCPDCGRPAKNNSSIRQGDVIDYLRQFMGKTFREACRMIDINPDTKQKASSFKVLSRESIAQPVFKDEILPMAKWIESTTRIVNVFNKKLNSNEEGQSYALSRGLTSDTWNRYKIGWSDNDYYLPVTEWGFPDEMNQNGNLRKFYIPKGLVIPTFRDNQVVSTTIRRPYWYQGVQYPKYHQLRKSGDGDLFYVAGDEGKPVVMVEGILDALLIAQDTEGAYCAIAENRCH